MNSNFIYKYSFYEILSEFDKICPNEYQKRFFLSKLVDRIEEYANQDLDYPINFKSWYLYKRARGSYANRSWLLKHLIKFCDRNPIHRLYKPKLVSLLYKSLRTNQEEATIRDKAIKKKDK